MADRLRRQIESNYRRRTWQGRWRCSTWRRPARGKRRSNEPTDGQPGAWLHTSGRGPSRRLSRRCHAAGRSVRGLHLADGRWLDRRWLLCRRTARSADSFADLITLSTRYDNEDDGDNNTVGNQAAGDWFIKDSLKLPVWRRRRSRDYAQVPLPQRRHCDSTYWQSFWPCRFRLATVVIWMQCLKWPVRGEEGQLVTGDCATGGHEGNSLRMG